jgi:hypothetical protein
MAPCMTCGLGVALGAGDRPGVRQLLAYREGDPEPKPEPCQACDRVPQDDDVLVITERVVPTCADSADSPPPIPSDTSDFDLAAEPPA